MNLRKIQIFSILLQISTHIEILFNIIFELEPQIWNKNSGIWRHIVT